MNDVLMAWANEYTFTHGALLINTEVHFDASDAVKYMRMQVINIFVGMPHWQKTKLNLKNEYLCVLAFMSIPS